MKTNNKTHTQTKCKKIGAVLSKKPRALGQGAAAVIEIELKKSICLDPQLRQLARFTLRSRGATVAAGVVQEILQ